MRRLRMCGLALAALVVSVSPARAEDKPKMVPEEGAVQIMLLRQQSVRDELKLTADETEKIHVFADRQWKKAQHVHSNMSAAEHRAQYEEMTKENDRFLDQILEPDQRKRFNQITLQVAGLMWVTRPEVASELKLTDDQIQKARGLQQEARKEMHDLIHSTTAEGRQEKLKELRMTSRKRLMELLTPEQESKWKEMAGAPFHGEFRFHDHESLEKSK